MKFFQKTSDFLFQTVSNCFTTVSRNFVPQIAEKTAFLGLRRGRPQRPDPFFEGDQEHSGDIHIAASLVEMNYTSLDAGRLNACCKILPPFYKELKTDKDVDLTDAQVLSDDRPVFEKLNNKGNEEWRQTAIDGLLAEAVKYKIPFFR